VNDYMKGVDSGIGSVVSYFLMIFLGLLYFGFYDWANYRFKKYKSKEYQPEKYQFSGFLLARLSILWLFCAVVVYLVASAFSRFLGDEGIISVFFSSFDYDYGVICQFPTTSKISPQDKFFL